MALARTGRPYLSMAIPRRNLVVRDRHPVGMALKLAVLSVYQTRIMRRSFLIGHQYHDTDMITHTSSSDSLHSGSLPCAAFPVLLTPNRHEIRQVNYDRYLRPTAQASNLPWQIDIRLATSAIPDGSLLSRYLCRRIFVFSAHTIGLALCQTIQSAQLASSSSLTA